MKKWNSLYPVFLKLENMQVLLVGAGNVALEKLESLLSNSPLTAITIVAPFIKPELKDYIKNYPGCKLIVRNFEETDLINKQIVVCATDNKTLHQHIKNLANAKNLLVNVADTPELCDFYLGSIVQKGTLKIAISTNGKSPTMAKRIKEVLHETIPDEINNLLLQLHQIRNSIKGNFAEKVKELNQITKILTDKSSD